MQQLWNIFHHFFTHFMQLLIFTKKLLIFFKSDFTQIYRLAGINVV